LGDRPISGSKTLWKSSKSLRSNLLTASLTFPRVTSADVCTDIRFASLFIWKASLIRILVGFVTSRRSRRSSNHFMNVLITITSMTFLDWKLHPAECWYGGSGRSSRLYCLYCPPYAFMKHVPAVVFIAETEPGCQVRQPPSD